MAACADAHAERVASASRACASARPAPADAARDASAGGEPRARDGGSAPRGARRGGGDRDLVGGGGGAAAEKTKAARRDAGRGGRGGDVERRNGEDARFAEASEASKHERQADIGIGCRRARPGALGGCSRWRTRWSRRVRRRAAGRRNRRQTPWPRTRRRRGCAFARRGAGAPGDPPCVRLERVADACARSLEKRSDPCLSRSWRVETAVAALGKTSAIPLPPSAFPALARRSRRERRAGVRRRRGRRRAEAGRARRSASRGRRARRRRG